MPERRAVVLDVSNIAYSAMLGSGDTRPRLDVFAPLCSTLRMRGCDRIVGIADASLVHAPGLRMTDLSLSLSPLFMLRIVRAGTSADLRILRYSMDHDALIVSLDRFRDWRTGWGRISDFVRRRLKRRLLRYEIFRQGSTPDVRLLPAG